MMYKAILVKVVQTWGETDLPLYNYSGNFIFRHFGTSLVDAVLCISGILVLVWLTWHFEQSHGRQIIQNLEQEVPVLNVCWSNTHTGTRHFHISVR